jgi:hypothetical protein
MAAVGDAYLELRLYYLWRYRSRCRISSTMGMNLADSLAKGLGYGGELGLASRRRGEFTGIRREVIRDLAVNSIRLA